MGDIPLMADCVVQHEGGVARELDRSQVRLSGSHGRFRRVVRSRRPRAERAARGIATVVFSGPAGVSRLIAAVLAVLLCVGLLTELSRAGSTVAAITVALPLALEGLLLVSGVLALGLGWPHRRGTHPHCRDCGYAHFDVADRLLSHCPECGNPWRNFGRSRRGEYRSSPWFVAAGAGLLMLGGTGWFIRNAAPEKLFTRLPDSLLIRYVLLAPPHSAPAGWTALRSRALSPLRTAELATGLLEKRDRDGVLDYSSQDWLDQVVVSTAVAPQIVTRYYEGMFDARLDVPEEVRVGDPIEATLVGSFRGRGGEVVGGYASVAVEQLMVELPQAPIDASPEVIAAIERAAADRESLITRQDGRQSLLRPAAQLALGVGSVRTRSSPVTGTATVRAKVWFLVAPTERPDLTWRDSGRTPEAAAPLTWSRHVTIERDVRIVARAR
jgi:hypothetical protein